MTTIVSLYAYNETFQLKQRLFHYHRKKFRRVHTDCCLLKTVHGGLGDYQCGLDDEQTESGRPGKSKVGLLREWFGDSKYYDIFIF